ncbi:hypothetical protein [Modestobacter roseus]|uniref:Uncharacterized protein n=1 Tax=Modestobacter roseus TaxID=1181884 RepID=A0A562IT38_9ACTN|nr:hypothetical protein [Modestobacter roseus]MQA35027.1 hypothetical protein [Modestobacter roseus]TWH74108.1 hypothetical protein JD78_02643 [Modestobacter roseus]
MNSTDFVVTGKGVVAPEPAAAACAPAVRPGEWTERVVLMAPTAAPFQGTGLSTTEPAVRLRALDLLATAAHATGATYGTDAHLIDPTGTGFAVSGVPALRTTLTALRTTSTTPGDLPPEDPLS